MKHLVVQLSGRQGSGKSSLAASLQKELERSLIYVSQHTYAKVLYEMHAGVLAVMSQYRKVPVKDGKLLQLLGTEWGRMVYGENVWVDIVRRNMQQIQTLFMASQTEGWAKQKSDHDAIVHIISDCRFPNEAEAFPGALVYRLDCADEIRKARIEACPGQCWREGYHASECALDDYRDFSGRFDSGEMSVEAITKVVLGDILHSLSNEVFHD